MYTGFEFVVHCWEAYRINMGENPTVGYSKAGGLRGMLALITALVVTFPGDATTRTFTTN